MFARYAPYIVTPESRAAFRCGSLPGVSITIAPLGTVSKGWIAFFNAWKLRRNVDLAKLTTEEDNDVVREWGEAVADYAIAGWSGLVGDDGAELAYSADTARALVAWLGEHAIGDLKALYIAASDLDTFRPVGAPALKPAKEVAGNS